MVEIGRKVLFLTGAPSSKSLEWVEDDLSASLQPCFAEDCPGSKQRPPSIEGAIPSWRALPLVQSHLPTGLTQSSVKSWSFQGHDGEKDETSFLSTSNLSYSSSSPGASQSQQSPSCQYTKEENLSQYYEHSFALHEDIPSSQILDPSSTAGVESFLTEPEEFSTAYTTNNDFKTDDQVTRSKLASSYLSDLKDIPNAAYLHSINPQTMTVNLVAGIISISEPRTIKTRRGGRSVELIEMLVGDDTRAGFGINIWLTPSYENNHSRSQEDNLRSNTLQLRPRDIVLVKQVALSSFKGNVYGQSLRRGMTTMYLLYRSVVDNVDRRGAFRAKDLEEESIGDLQILKLKRVKNWVTQFVGAGAQWPGGDNKSKAQSRRIRQLEALPTDTP
ncbi:hypothetical protein N7G274_006321 [Stereocaulon virgatum]|uniref:Uncharacterized protein n=1 Tax=Stereocaulon virgatum TaxID=373712 RepID=A0ABR4A723_9LECA